MVWFLKIKKARCFDKQLTLILLSTGDFSAEHCIHDNLATRLYIQYHIIHTDTDNACFNYVPCQTVIILIDVHQYVKVFHLDLK